jgi:hypothetical protein
MYCGNGRVGIRLGDKLNWIYSIGILFFALAVVISVYEAYYP